MSRALRQRAVSLTNRSTVWPGARPFTVEWYINVDDNAFRLWGLGGMTTERWSKLDSYIRLRTFYAIAEGRYDPTREMGLA